MCVCVCVCVCEFVCVREREPRPLQVCVGESVCIAFMGGDSVYSASGFDQEFDECGV